MIFIVIVAASLLFLLLGYKVNEVGKKIHRTPQAHSFFIFSSLSIWVIFNGQVKNIFSFHDKAPEVFQILFLLVSLTAAYGLLIMLIRWRIITPAAKETVKLEG